MGRSLGQAGGRLDRRFLGAGFAGPDYVQRTVAVATKLAKVLADNGIPVGIGVHSGIAYFGAMGTSDGLTDITAIRKEVNAAARVASKVAAGEVIVSDIALQEAGIDTSAFVARRLELKGITEPVAVRVIRGG